MRLSEEQLDRYAHHIILKDIGGEGQRRLLGSSVLIIGLGGLGSPAALYLAAAGVGRIGIMDDDSVSVSNLQRQIIHETADLGRSKVASASEKMRALNPDVKLCGIAQRLCPGNAVETFRDYDFIIDCTDNFATKYLINDTCISLAKPYSHSGVVGFRGQAFTYVPGSLCLRCIFPEPPPDGCVLHCRGAGVVGAIAGLFGAVQAAEAIKYLLGKEGLLSNKVLTVDLMNSEFRTVDLHLGESCPCREKRRSI